MYQVFQRTQLQKNIEIIGFLLHQTINYTFHSMRRFQCHGRHLRLFVRCFITAERGFGMIRGETFFNEISWKTRLEIDYPRVGYEGGVARSRTFRLYRSSGEMKQLFPSLICCTEQDGRARRKFELPYLDCSAQYRTQHFFETYCHAFRIYIVYAKFYYVYSYVKHDKDFYCWINPSENWMIIYKFVVSEYGTLCSRLLEPSSKERAE